MKSTLRGVVFRTVQGLAWLAVLELATRCSGATISWTGGSGDWADPSHWIGGGVPGPDDDARIDDAAVSVTHSSGSNRIRSLHSEGALNLTGGTLSVATSVQVNNAFTISGGTLAGATLLPGIHGEVIAAPGGTLSGVTVNGDISVVVGTLFVTDGMTLNGILHVGNETGQGGGVRFDGSQSLLGTGTVLFGNAACNTLSPGIAGTTLTFGPGITFRGVSGTVGSYDFCGLIDNFTLIHQGRILSEAPGGRISLGAREILNTGEIRMSNGGSLSLSGLSEVAGLTAEGGGVLTLGGTWTNTGVLKALDSRLVLTGTWNNSGTIAATNAAVDLRGSGRSSSLGTLATSNTVFQILGTLDNDGGTLFVGPEPRWSLAGGTIRGGTLNIPEGVTLPAPAGTLSGVTVNGDISVVIGTLFVTDGLTLNGILHVGNETGQGGGVRFDGSQSLLGTGTVLFGNAACNTLSPGIAGTTLTLGPGITLRGVSGTVGSYDFCGLIDNFTLIHQGRILSEAPGGLISIGASTVVNSGELRAGPSAGLRIATAGSFIPGILVAEPGASVQVRGTVDLADDSGFEFSRTATLSVTGDFTSGLRNPDTNLLAGDLLFPAGGSPESPRTLEVLGIDRGPGSSGFQSNLVLGSLVLAENAHLRLVDNADNQDGAAAEALYVDRLVVPTTASLDLDGHRLYARFADIRGTLRAAGPPQVVLSPAASRIVSGTAIELAAFAAGDSPMTYQWYRDGYEITGATNRTLALNPVAASQAGDYTVRVSNGTGETVSPGGRVDVLVPPLILRDPQPVTVRAGDPALFEVRIEGTPPFTFDWLRDDGSLGAPSDSSLLIQTASSAESGRISVRVSNAAGTALSAGTPLRVLEPDRLQRPLPLLTVVELDGELVLAAEVAGSGPLSFQWRLNGQDIPGANAPEYRVRPVGLPDAGMYTLLLANEIDTVTGGPAEVRINLPVVPGGDLFSTATDLSTRSGPISASNRTATREPGEPRHAGKSGAHSVWYRWIAPGGGRVAFRTVGSGFDTLLAVYTGDRISQLTEVASNDDASDGSFFASEIRFSARQGETYFVAVDGLGDDSGNYVLSWQFDPGAPVLPRITLHPDSQTQPPGTPVILRVTADNATTIDWEFNGRPLAGVSGGTLTLDSVTPADVGTYVAVVRGDGGIVRSHPAVVEIGPQVGARSYDKQAELDPIPAPAPRVNRQAEGGLGLLLSPGRPVEQWVNNEVNTTQLAEANHCGRLVRRTGWMLLEVERDGQLVITATNSTVPLVMALYAFSDPDQSLACADGSRLVLPDAKAGRLYSLVFGSATDAGGLIELVYVSGTPPPAPSAPAPPTEVEPGRRVTLEAPLIAGLEPAPKYQWYRNGRAIEGANAASLILDSFTPERAGDYSVVLDNGVGRAEYAIGTLNADLPLGPSRPPESADGVFTFHLSGNAGQRVMVEQGYDIGVWHTREEFWLPEGGQDYRDDAMAVRGHQLFHYAEVPLTVTEGAPLTDGRRTWRISGGRIGDRYVLEQSLNGTQWAPVRTNRVEVGPFLHVEPAGFNASLRARRAE